MLIIFKLIYILLQSFFFFYEGTWIKINTIWKKKVEIFKKEC